MAHKPRAAGTDAAGRRMRPACGLRVAGRVRAAALSQARARARAGRVGRWQAAPGLGTGQRSGSIALPARAWTRAGARHVEPYLPVAGVVEEVAGLVDEVGAALRVHAHGHRVAARRDHVVPPVLVLVHLRHLACRRAQLSAGRACCPPAHHRLVCSSTARAGCPGGQGDQGAGAAPWRYFHQSAEPPSMMPSSTPRRGVNALAWPGSSPAESPHMHLRTYR